jgi:hypothetical protein
MKRTLTICYTQLCSTQPHSDSQHEKCDLHDCDVQDREHTPQQQPFGVRFFQGCLPAFGRFAEKWIGSSEVTTKLTTKVTMKATTKASLAMRA